MKIEELFGFLIKDYGLTYRYQEFSNCYSGKWTVHTHSFYNDSGCFTIYIEIQELCEREIDVSSIEPQIWKKFEKKWIFKWPFFWWNDNKVLNALAEVLKVHLAKNDNFFGIQIL